MAGENFCAESLERRRRDVSVLQTSISADLRSAEAAAERADLISAFEWIGVALSNVAKLRNDIEDLAMERERQMDAEGDE